MPTQQFPLYAAELEIPEGELFPSLKAVHDWVNGLRESAWWEAQVPMVLGIDVYHAAPGQTSQAWFEEENSAGVMEFNTPTPSMRVVVHELAHVLAHARRHSRSHDPWYARVLLELTYLLRGLEIYTRLQSAYDKHNVVYNAGGLA